MATSRRWTLPKYTPHAFRSKEQSAREYEQLAILERRIAKDYVKAAETDTVAQRNPDLKRQWRATARKHLQRAEKAEKMARSMRKLGMSRDPNMSRDPAPRQRRSVGFGGPLPTQSDRAYVQREVTSFQQQLREVERLPLSERKENAAEFAETLRREPELIAERIGWLLNGSYGYGSYIKAQEVARSPRMNQGAWLVQTIAALEWSVPARMTAQAWHTLSAAQRTYLDRLVKKEIKNHLSEA